MQNIGIEELFRIALKLEVISTEHHGRTGKEKDGAWLFWEAWGETTKRVGQAASDEKQIWLERPVCATPMEFLCTPMELGAGRNYECIEVALPLVNSQTPCNSQRIAFSPLHTSLKEYRKQSRISVIIFIIP
jgi:hypothetical protein